MKGALAGLVALALSGPTALAPEQRAADPAVVKGIAEVDNGEYDAAILTLDAAARRLAGDPGRRPDYVQACVYLGVAYLATGHETSAKNRFRDALAAQADLRLSPEKFAPRVVELFE